LIDRLVGGFEDALCHPDGVVELRLDVALGRLHLVADPLSGVAVALVDGAHLPVGDGPRLLDPPLVLGRQRFGHLVKPLLDLTGALLVSVLRLGQRLLQPFVNLGLGGGRAGGEFDEVAQGGALLLAVIDPLCRRRGSAVCFRICGGLLDEVLHGG
jgi:hypothetical protein